MDETTRICAFCGASLGEGACPNCGGNAATAAPKEEVWQEPFLYNGYILWASSADYWRYDQISYHFFLGDTLVETIVITRDLLREFVPEGQSYLPFLWELFKVAQGEQEVARVQTMNRRKPAAFEIRRVPTDQEEEITRLKSLPERELFQEIFNTQQRR